MRNPEQEPDIVPGGKLTGVTIAVVLSIIIGVWVAWGLGSCATRQPGARWTTGGAAEPLVRQEPSGVGGVPFVVEAQALELNRRIEQSLRTYSWVDRDRQIVRVPIEVAFDLYLERARGQGGTR